MTSIRVSVFLTVMLLPLLGLGQQFELELIPTQDDASFRGLSVVDDEHAWVSGSKGWIGLTHDGGATWKFCQVPGFEAFDFRSVFAFDESKAVIANAGAPANVLLTRDGGKTWQQVYVNNDTSAFIDGVDFWNEEEGIIYGDPINHRMLLLKTVDGGESWSEVAEMERPLLNDGEASFAASGTNIRCIGTREVMIATGGRTSRIWQSLDKGKTWRTIAVPIIQGEPSTGIFSFTKMGSRIIVVGGDYLRETLKTNHAFYSIDKGRNWRAPSPATRGYRECVEFIGRTTVLATGPAGTDISHDGGETWIPFSDEKYFHVARKARKGKLVLLAGGKGKIGIVCMK